MRAAVGYHTPMMCWSRVKRWIGTALLVVAATVLAACGGDPEQSILERFNAGSTQGPDEFTTLPVKPLELPEDLAALPAPDPAARNRSDLTPRADALAVLSGGRGGAGATASDNAVLAAARTGSRQSNIRALLAEEDAEFRANNRGRPLDRLLGNVTEDRVYAAQLLDAEEEAERLRRLGLRVPALPPENRR